MFCPYVRKTYTKITKIAYSDSEVENGSIVHETYTNAECKRNTMWSLV